MKFALVVVHIHILFIDGYIVVVICNNGLEKRLGE